MDFRTLKSLTIPEGIVTKITNAAGTVLWQKKNESLPNYVKFSSASPFTITIGKSTVSYNGTLYSTTNPEDWSNTGTSGSALTITPPKIGAEYTVYMRGSGNTRLSSVGSSSVYPWGLTAAGDVYCSGNLESLLDYETVETGGHPTMATYCCQNMFASWTNLVSAPVLPSPALSEGCYHSMFAGCSGLTAAPSLPATSLAAGCYYGMFRNCSSLTMAPAISATTLAASCCALMFAGCTSLVGLPALYSTPVTLPTGCYSQMFMGCTSIKLSATKTDNYSVEYRIPMSGTITQTMTTSCGNMFKNTGGSFTGAPTLNTTYYLDASNSIVYSDHLTFTSTNTLSISVGTPGWDGAMEYSTDLYSWNTWDGSEISGTVIYLRGSNNTKVTGVSDDSCSWTITGSSVSCCGNIEALLDYSTTIAGAHPSMAEYCYCAMFYNCSALVSAPGLPATTLSNSCYRYMFYNCTSLTASPALPATVLTPACYYGMFYGCSALTTAPTLSANGLATSCYYGMFYNCTSLTTAPELPALSLESGCYYYMFCGCSALATAPALPATILATYCYYGMFANCTSLTAAPALPATALATYCYYRMFYGCTALKTIPALEAITLKTYCYYQMFYNCSSIEISSNTSSGLYPLAYRIPYTTTNTGKTATNALSNMFYGTTAVSGGVTTPTINTTYGLGSNNSIITISGEVISE